MTLHAPVMRRKRVEASETAATVQRRIILPPRQRRMRLLSLRTEPMRFSMALVVERIRSRFFGRASPRHHGEGLPSSPSYREEAAPGWGSRSLRARFWSSFLALPASVQLVVAYAVGRHRLRWPSAEEGAEVFHARSRRVQGAETLQHVILKIGARHRVEREWRAFGHRGQIERGVLLSAHGRWISTGRLEAATRGLSDRYPHIRSVAGSMQVLFVQRFRPDFATWLTLGLPNRWSHSRLRGPYGSSVCRRRTDGDAPPECRGDRRRLHRLSPSDDGRA